MPLSSSISSATRHSPLSNNSTSQVPNNNQVVTITKPILLDTATARLGGVDIQNGGRLVFSPGKVFSINKSQVTDSCYIRLA